MVSPSAVIDVTPGQWTIVRGILLKHVPDYEVWAFGSRTQGSAKPFSDLDLAIVSEQPLSLDLYAALSDDFSESDLPWKVDVVDWASTSNVFRAIIERDKVILQIPRARQNASEPDRGSNQDTP